VYFERTAALPLPEGKNWPRTSEPIVASLDVDRHAIAAKLGPPGADDDRVAPGLGRIEAWAARFPCGCEIVLWWRHDNRVPGQGADVLANDADVDHVVHHVTDAFAAPISWRADGNPGYAPDPWSLVRQGDDGNRVVMRTFASKIAAECARRTFEARGHKQLYTVERPAR
jgi:hypothetical protein